MKKKRLIAYGFILILAVSILLNYHLYQKNRDFKIKIGTENQVAVKRTLFTLNAMDADFWIEALNHEHGSAQLARHIGKLQLYSGEFDRMNGKTSTISMLLSFLKHEYYDLEEGLQKGENIEEPKENIDNIIQAITDILAEIDSDLGEDELKWYRELSTSETDTQEFIWQKFKEFESKHMK